MLNKMPINHWISLSEHTVLFRVNFHINSSLYFYDDAKVKKPLMLA